MAELQLQEDGSYALFLGNVPVGPPPETHPWTIVTEPSASTTTFTIPIRDYDPGDTNVFKTHSEATVAFKAVKLTEKNIKDVAGEIAKAGLDITWFSPDNFETGEANIDIDSVQFEVGEWVVEDYDYDIEHVIFRHATAEERRKYDLR